MVATVHNVAKRRTTTQGPTAGRGAQHRLSIEVRRQLLGAIYAGEPFRQVLRDLDLTSNKVCGGSPKPTQSGRPRSRKP